MSPKVPTTQELSANIIAQLESSLGVTIPILPKAFSRVLSKAIAGVLVTGYKYSAWNFLQMYARFASTRETVVQGRTIVPLIELGRQLGVGDPKPATRAELTVQLRVLNQSGTLPGNSQYVRTETGVIYLTTETVLLDATTKQVTIRAASDQQGGSGAGAIGNLRVGDRVELANALPNVAREATVVAVETQGANAEDLDTTYRQRVVDRRQKPPQGGAYADYEAWAEEVEGIIHAYPYSGLPGEVDVYVEATEASSGSPDGIPTAAQIIAVEESIALNQAGVATRRPANAAINVLPIRRARFDVTITGLAVDNPSTVQADVEQGVDEHLRSLEPFIVGLSVLPRKDRVTRGDVWGVVAGVVSAAGGTVNSVSVDEAGSDFEARTLGAGEKAKLGSVSYI